MSYKMTTRRKMAIASWASPKEPNIYGKLTVNMREALRYIEYLRLKTHEKVTITHIVGKVAALALQAAPNFNGRIVCGKYVPHDTVDISFLASLSDGEDLAKVKIENIDQKSVVQVAQEMQVGATKLILKKVNHFCVFCQRGHFGRFYGRLVM